MKTNTIVISTFLLTLLLTSTPAKVTFARDGADNEPRLSATTTRERVRQNLPPELRDRRASSSASTTEDRGRENNQEKKQEGEIRNDRGRLEDLKIRAQAERRNLEAKRLGLIKTFATRMKTRLTAAIERVEKLADRASRAIDEFTARGQDTATAKDHLAKAKIKIIEAKDSLALFDRAISEALSTSSATSTDDYNPKTIFAAVRKIVNTTLDKIQLAHKEVVAVIRSLRDFNNENDRREEREHTATSTATSTDN